MKKLSGILIALVLVLSFSSVMAVPVGANGAILEVNGPPVQLATGALNLGSFSPDGSKIVYGGAGAIWVMNADGSDPQIVYGSGSRPKWGPDGLIALAGTGITIIQPDGTLIKTIDTSHLVYTEATITATHSLDWSPDGTKLAFSDSWDGTAGIWTVDYATGDLTQITDYSQTAYAPAWSPDGTEIACAWGGSPNMFVGVFSSAGALGGSAPLRTIGIGGSYGGDYPDWGANGKIAYHDGTKALHVMNADGAGDTVVFAGPAAMVAWSPDGQTLAYVDATSGLFGNVWTRGYPYAVIQDAVDAATDGDTVNVAAGTYAETVTIGAGLDNLTLQGASPTNTVISKGIKFDSNAGDIAGVSVINFTIWGNAGTGVTVGHTGNGYLYDLTFDNNVFDGQDTVGMCFYINPVAGDFTFTNNEVTGYTDWGTLYVGEDTLDAGTDGPSLSTVTFQKNNIHDNKGSSVVYGNKDNFTDEFIIQDNEFRNNGGHEWFWAAIEVMNADNVLVENNVFEGSPVGMEGVHGAALYLTNDNDGLFNGDVVRNDFLSNYQGIYVYSGDMSGLRVHFNNFLGNDTAIDTLGEGSPLGVLDATHNWWGHVTGPAHASNPHTSPAGNAVNGNVDFIPWYATATTTPTTENVLVDHPELPGSIIAISDTIQGGIDAALSGDTILVAAGTYDEHIIITKSNLILVGEDKETTVIDARQDSSWEYPKPGILINGVGEVTVSGFTIRDAALDENGAPWSNDPYGPGPQAMTAILIYATSNNNAVENNILINNHWGVFVCAEGAATTECKNNRITNNIIGDSGQDGVYLYTDGVVPVENTQIVNNEIYNCYGSGASGVEFWAWPETEPKTLAITGTVISGNLITGCTYGVRIKEDVSDITATSINLNNFADNSIQVLDATETLDIQQVLAGNIFDRAVVIDRSGFSLLHTIWSRIQDGINAASSGDTINVAAGTYDESVTINKNNLTLTGEVSSRPAITGGLKLDTDLTGLTLQNFYVSGTVDPAKNSVVRMYGAITNLTVDNCVFDGEDIADRMGFTGGQIEGDLTVTSSEFKNILGWAVLDSRSGSGGDGSAMGTVTFMGNNIHDCNGSIVFRGLSTDRTDLVNVYGNTFNNIGGNEGQLGQHWAALEINHAVTANVYDNTVNGVSEGEWGEGQAFQFWDIDTLNVYNNDITNNYQGIFIFGGELGGTYGGPYAIPGGSISFNNIVDNTQYGIDVDPNAIGGPLNATNNWWGTGTAATVTTMVSGNVAYDPWHLKQMYDVTIGSITQNSIVLSWTTDGAWNGEHYDIRYSTSPITPGNWDSAKRVAGEPKPANTIQGMIISKLSSGTTYYFGVTLKHGNKSSDISEIVSATTLTVAPVDNTPPDRVTALASLAGSPATTSVVLNWPATGDDGATGFATRYIIKQSTSVINTGNFDKATELFNTLTPKASGQTESFTVSRLNPNTTYYFAIKVQDKVPNTSEISNVVSIKTANLLPTVSGIEPATGNNGDERTLIFTGTNFADAGATVVRLVSGDNVLTLTNVTVSNNTQLKAVVPIGVPTGTYKARVTNNNGTSKLSPVKYIVTEAPVPLPVVTNLIPHMAATDTATNNVRIIGKNLADATAVRINGIDASNISVISNTRITVNVPGLPAGEYDVKVTTSALLTNQVSTVKFVVIDPAKIDATTTEDTTTSGVIKLENTNVIPVQITMTTDNSETASRTTDADVEISVVIPPGTAITDSAGTPYTGTLNPPRVIKPDESVHTDLPEDAIVIEMGNPEQTIKFSQDFVATVKVTASSKPDIYYYNKDTGEYELAGETGAINGIVYVPGGTVLGLENSTYTIGLLLDHMSVYVASVKSLIPPPPTPPQPLPVGGGVALPPPPPGTTDVSGKVTHEGVFTRSVTTTSEDELCTLTIPSGTVGLTEELEPLDEITMVIMDEPPPPPEDDEIVGLSYDFGPDGATFDPPITLEYSYDPDDIPDWLDEEDLVFAMWDEDVWNEDTSEWGVWVVLEGCTVDKDTHTITAPVSHFTTFAVIARHPLAPPPPPAPAAFSVSDLSIQPAEVRPKESVTITVSVANTGGTEGSYSVVLKINGVREAEKRVTVAADSIRDVSFTVAKETTGTYLVNVKDLGGSFTVALLPPAPAPVPTVLPEVEVPINWALLAGIMGVLVAAGLLMFILMRRRAP